MTFLVLPAIGTLAFDPSSLLSTYPALGCELAGHGLSQLLYSYLKRSVARRGLSRHEMRKMASRRRRWFVDNIIMHHRRLADRNRQIIVSNSLERILASKKRENNDQQRNLAEDSFNKWGRNRWRGGDESEIKNRGSDLRSRLKLQKSRRLSWINTQIEEDRRTANLN